MKGRRRLMAIVGAAISTALLVTGCSSTPSGGPSASGTAASGQPSASGTVTFWWPPVGGDDAINAQLAEFTKETGIKVNVVSQNWDTYFQTLTTALTTGVGPDVAAIGNTWTASFQPVGGLVEFGDAQWNAIGGKDRFLAAPLSSTSPPNQTPVAVPWLAQTYALYYNKKTFAAAGISAPPTTWDEFIADGKKLTANGNYGTSATGASTSGPNTTLLWAIIRQFGGNLFGADGKPTFTDPKVVAAVKSYLSWFTEGIANPASAEYTGDEAVKDFASGKSAMLIGQNSDIAAAVADGMSPDDLGVAYTPVLNPLPAGGEKVLSHVAGINLVVYKSAPNQAGAMALIKFLTSAPAQIAVNKASGNLPVVQDAYSDPAFSTPEYKVLQDIAGNYSQPLPMVPQQGQMQTILGTAITHLVAQTASSGTISDADITAALNDANQQMAALG